MLTRPCICSLSRGLCACSAIVRRLLCVVFLRR